MKLLRVAVGLVAAVVLTVQPAMAAKTVYVNVNPNTTAPGGIVPDVNGVNAVYNYTVYDGQAVSDSIPVQVCMTGSEAGWTSIAVTFGGVSGNLNGVSLPLDQTFLATTATPDCRNLSIDINTGALNLADPNVSQNFVGNIGLADSSPAPSIGGNRPSVAWADIKNIQIKIEVLPATNSSNVSCFLTDSEGLFLKDCTGASVTESGSDDGRFTIVANKKLVEVATNPGQFYFNFVWLNTTGADQTVTVTFDRTGVVAHGAQAIHAAVFSGYLSTIDPPAFDDANANGIPEGQDDVAEDILVPAGSSLLVTYHLTWEGLGSAVPAGCAGTCGTANQLLQVVGTVSGAGITSESCTATAYGFKK